MRPSAASKPDVTERLPIERRLGDLVRTRLPGWFGEFVMFGLKMGWACLFAGLLLVAIIATSLFWPEGARLARYDALTLFAIAVQVAMLATGLESRREAGVILLFHATGTVMEIFKLSVGSWDYPEAGLLKLGGVPLFSGFMYASVGSFMARAIRLFDMRFIGHPPMIWSLGLALAIYMNFYTHHYWYDLRYLLFAASVAVFGRTWVEFRPIITTYKMPIVLTGILSALFLYIAENIGTLSGTWIYHGTQGVALTNPAKMGSWYLLLWVSFAQVSLICPASRS